MRIRFIMTPTLSLLLGVRAFCEVVACEFLADPFAEGWELSQEFGELTTWVEGGAYYQSFANNCQPGPVCGTQSLVRTIEAFNGQLRWFCEYRASATGTSAEIANGAPTVFSAFNAAGNLYHVSLASDKVKLSGDADLPILFLDVESGIPHTIRLELNNNHPARFRWYVDSVLVLEGLADSPFPDFDARIKWQGRTWMQPTLNSWYYIRFGDIPQDASGDFDSEVGIDLRDFYFLHECLTNERIGINGGPGNDAGQGCRWADFEGDADVDLLDLAAFQNLFDPGH